jgi:predicted transcriptional regulator of viral defense system
MVKLPTEISIGVFIARSNNTGRRRCRFDRAVAVFKKHGGILRTSHALRAGIHPGTLYAMRDSGTLEEVSRGVYRLAESQPLGNPDLVAVAARVPRGVICLISALAFHGLATQIPHEVHVALPRGAEEPRLDHPPIRTHRFSGEAFTQGVETHELDGVSVRVYSPEKTLADCFKFRNRVGLDTAMEAVRLYRERRTVKVDALIRYAAICRAEVEPDGVSFYAVSVTAATTTAEAEYEGVRVRLRGSLGNARVSLQIDIGFGDAIVPEPCKVMYPVLLDFPAPELNGYTRESTIAEKFH